MTDAYVTLITSENYIPGAITLAHSLRLSGTNKKVVCMVTPEIEDTARDQLLDPNHLYDELIKVQPFNSFDTDNLALLGRPELGVTLTKIHVWKLIKFRYVVFVDADAMVLRNIDELFDRLKHADRTYNSEVFAAAPDSGWPDNFNSGLFACKPSLQTYSNLKALALSSGSFDGADQGLLNRYFKNWSNSSYGRLSFTFNVTPSAYYTYAPAYAEYMSNIRVVHFIGQDKPWTWNLRFADGKIMPRGFTSHQFKALALQWWSIRDHFDDYKKNGYKNREYHFTYTPPSPPPSPPPQAPSQDHSRHDDHSENHWSQPPQQQYYNNDNNNNNNNNNNNASYNHDQGSWEHHQDHAWEHQQHQQQQQQQQYYQHQDYQQQQQQQSWEAPQQQQQHWEAPQQNYQEQQQQQWESTPPPPPPQEHHQEYVAPPPPPPPQQPEPQPSWETWSTWHPTDNAWQEQPPQQDYNFQHVDDFSQSQSFPTWEVVKQPEPPVENKPEPFTFVDYPKPPHIHDIMEAYDNKQVETEEISVVEEEHVEAMVEEPEEEKEEDKTYYNYPPPQNSQDINDEFSSYKIGWNYGELRGFQLHMPKPTEEEEENNRLFINLPGIRATSLYSQSSFTGIPNYYTSVPEDNNDNMSSHKSSRMSSYGGGMIAEYGVETSSFHGGDFSDKGTYEVASEYGSESQSYIPDTTSSVHDETKEGEIDLDNYDIYGYSYVHNLRRRSDSITSETPSGHRRLSRRRSIASSISMDFEDYQNTKNTFGMPDPYNYNGIIENNFHDDLFVDYEVDDDQYMDQESGIEKESGTGVLEGEGYFPEEFDELKSEKLKVTDTINITEITNEMTNAAKDTVVIADTYITQIQKEEEQPPVQPQVEEKVKVEEVEKEEEKVDMAEELTQAQEEEEEVVVVTEEMTQPQEEEEVVVVAEEIAQPQDVVPVAAEPVEKMVTTKSDSDEKVIEFVDDVEEIIEVVERPVQKVSEQVEVTKESYASTETTKKVDIEVEVKAEGQEEEQKVEVSEEGVKVTPPTTEKMALESKKISTKVEIEKTTKPKVETEEFVDLEVGQKVEEVEKISEEKAEVQAKTEKVEKEKIEAKAKAEKESEKKSEEKVSVKKSEEKKEEKKEETKEEKAKVKKESKKESEEKVETKKSEAKKGSKKETEEKAQTKKSETKKESKKETKEKAEVKKESKKEIEGKAEAKKSESKKEAKKESKKEAEVKVETKKTEVKKESKKESTAEAKQEAKKTTKKESEEKTEAKKSSTKKEGKKESKKEAEVKVETKKTSKKESKETTKTTKSSESKMESKEKTEKTKTESSSIKESTDITLTENSKTVISSNKYESEGKVIETKEEKSVKAKISVPELSVKSTKTVRVNASEEKPTYTTKITKKVIRKSSTGEILEEKKISQKEISMSSSVTSNTKVTRTIVIKNKNGDVVETKTLQGSISEIEDKTNSLIGNGIVKITDKSKNLSTKVRRTIIRKNAKGEILSTEVKNIKDQESLDTLKPISMISLKSDQLKSNTTLIDNDDE